jgi:threonine/homoserine/homoserine lactone efflux protein
MVHYIVIGFFYAFACVVQPGPFLAYLFSQSLSNGWRKTIPLAFAPLMSDGPIIVLVLLVLTKIPHAFLQLLQCIGGVFLLYLAFSAYKTWRNFNQNDSKYVSVKQNVFKAVMVNFLNPNPYLGWSLVMGPLLLSAWKESPATGISFLAGFYSTVIICSMGMVILFASARNFGQRINRIFIAISVAALAIFGCYQLWSGVAGLC